MWKLITENAYEETVNIFHCIISFIFIILSLNIENIIVSKIQVWLYISITCWFLYEISILNVYTWIML